MRSPLLSLPSLDAIRGFVAVARRMSITAAAHDLCLTQSAVSRQVKLLEDHWGTPLLVRKARAIELTEVGTELYRLAGPWLDQLSGFSQALTQRGRASPVTVTASIGVSSLWLLPRLGSFQAEHPNIDIRVVANNRLLDIEIENIDLAIRYCTEASVSGSAIRLFGEVVTPVARKDVAIQAFDDDKRLLDQNLLELDERSRPWLRWSEWLAARGLGDARPKAYLYFNQYDQVIQAAVEGHGVALGRLGLILPMIEDGRLVAQPSAQHGTSNFAYWMAKHDSAWRNDVQLFADWVTREAQATAASLSAIAPKGK
jgi:LysR family glycine cleavage system transcriptional activator